MDIGERKRIIEQTRRELADEIKQYVVGSVMNGELFVKKNSSDWNGHLLVIPEDKYKELLMEG